MNIVEVFWIFLRLGLTSFGGPIAHLGYFHDEFVTKRKWINEHAYVDLVALCQFLPGPASSQVGIALGLSRAGYLGAIAAWIGFTLPSAIILVLFAFGISTLSGSIHQGYLHGLKIAAVAVVAQAIWAMSAKLCPDKIRASIAIAAAIVVSLIPSAFAQVGIIILGGILGVLLLKKGEHLPHVPITSKSSKTAGVGLLLVFFSLLLTLPILAGQTHNSAIKQFDSFFRAGSLVFGGGHVVLPLLKAEVVDTGRVTNEAFMAGYGAAQAIPGPLFTFSAYLGAISSDSSSGILGAALCLVAAFLPSYLLIVGVLPFWEDLRKHEKMKLAMKGINASVVGLLISAFYNPVWSSAIFNIRDFSLALGVFVLLVFWKAPSWLVVIICALLSGLILN